MIVASIGRHPALACRGRTSARSTPQALPVVHPPPTTFDLKAATRAFSTQFIQSRYPELRDLADSGALVVVARPEHYVERRQDGYQEPELVFVLGTAHVSPVSATDAARVIQAVRPESVVIELCRSRTAILEEEEGSNDGGRIDKKASNAMSLSGPSFPEAVRRSLQLGGRSALFLRILLSFQAQRAASRLGVRPGMDARAAYKAAKAVDSQLVLGDRPIEITLRRAWAALSWRRRAALAGQLVRSWAGPRPEITPALVEAMQQDDAVTAALQQLSADYPEVAGALVHERDLYLAWSLQRSKAVNGAKRVVGVVGRGHLRGVCYHLLTNPGAIRFRDLVGRSSAPRTGLVPALARLGLETALAAGLWVVWQSRVGH